MADLRQFQQQHAARARAAAPIGTTSDGSTDLVLPPSASPPAGHGAGGRSAAMHAPGPTVGTSASTMPPPGSPPTPPAQAQPLPRSTNGQPSPSGTLDSTQVHTGNTTPPPAPPPPPPRPPSRLQRKLRDAVKGLFKPKSRPQGGQGDNSGTGQ